MCDECKWSQTTNRLRHFYVQLPWCVLFELFVRVSCCSVSVTQDNFSENMKPDLESAWSKLSDHESSAAFRHFCKHEGVFQCTYLNSLETELFFIAKRWHSNSQDTFYVILGEQNHQIIIFDDTLTLNLRVKKISQLFSPHVSFSDCPANVPI